MSAKIIRRRSLWMSRNVVFILVFCFNESLLKCLANDDVLHTFVESSVSASQLRNFVYNGQDRALYVGAVNTIYRLTGDLRMNGSIVTGPHPDITECRDTSFSLSSCSRAPTASSCINQALALDVSSNTLIVCGTLYYGSCVSVSLKSFVLNQNAFRPVVPNDPSKSVVLVVAPGPENNNALFVASSYSRINMANPAFSQPGLLAVRKLSSFELSHVDQSSSSSIDIRSDYQTNFNVVFRRAVHLSGHVYFFAIRPKSMSSSDMTSHVLRICTNDRQLNSLVELQLECKVNGVVYPYLRDMATWKLNNQVAVDNGRLRLQGDMLFGAFTTGTADAGDTAICAYQLSDFENAFQDTLQKCFYGQGLKGPEYIVQTEQCTHTDIKIDGSFCGNYSNVNHPVFSNASFKATFGTVVTQATVTALQIRDVNSKIFGLLGTSDGQLLKVTIATNVSLLNQTAVYARVNLKQDRTMPVKQIVVGNENAVYLLTEKAVVSVRLYNCSSRLSCDTCVADPHCAWCLQSNRCAEVATCARVMITTRCPRVVNFRPHQISETDFKNTSITVTTDMIPPSFGRVNCSVRDLAGSYKAISSAIITDTLDGNKLVTCKAFATVPVFSAKSIYLNLSVSLQVQDLTWASVPLAAYSCNSIKSCIPCTQSNYLCRWCVVTHRCLPAAKMCGSDPVFSVNLTSQCPSVILISENNSFPSGKAINLTVIGRNMMSIYRSSSLTCQVITPRGAVRYPATLEMQDSLDVVVQANIVCPNIKLAYDGNEANIFMAVAVLWKDHVLDSPVQMKVEVYKCEYIVLNCGQCVTLDAKYGCSWCANRRQCSLQEDCTDGLWISANDTCPNPQIHSFTPQGGPLSGGTKLTVTGENLGTAISQLDISIGDKKCHAIADNFVPTVSFVCTTEPVKSSVDSLIKVTVNNMFSVTSAGSFKYMDSTVTSWTPVKGPCSGGTIVSVSGSNLHFGSNVAVTFSGLPARILGRNSSHIEFASPRLNTSVRTPSSIVMTVDNMDYVLHSPDTFLYVEDPAISSVHPFTSVASGGNKIEVRGGNLNAAAKPLFIVYYNNTNYTTPCVSTTSSTFMNCHTPGLSDFISGLDYPVTVEYGFIMDDVVQLRKINSQSFSDFEPFKYIQDPKVFSFDQTVVYKEGMKLTILGENLTPYKQFQDIVVLVGGTGCKLAAVESDTEITCDPPAVDAKLNLKDGNAQVTVQLGNFMKDVGFLSYYERGPPYGLIFGLIFGISIPIIIIIFVVYFICIRRKNENTRKPPQPIVSQSSRPRPETSVNSYLAAETIPLQTRKNTDIVSPKEAELVKDDAHYFQELLKKIENPRIRNAAKEVYISRERLEIGAMLGKGHFGCVYAATLRDAAMKNPVAVAVKTIEDSDLDQKMVENFVQEGIIMKNFNHPHVLSLLGLCLGYRKEPMVILPFMANGDLRTFVKDKSRMFTARQLLQLAQQVAEGMSYLSSLNFIHRDLAARNCMIDDKNQVKVADFGLSRELFERQYYSSKDRKAKLPVKWMALESLEDFIFTAKSDVWSFGVLMWELMTRGVTPYPDVEVTEMRTYLASGRRLRKPKYCPDNVYGIMTDCWHNVPETRPTFTDLVNRLELLLNPQKKNKSVTREAEEEPTYINVADTEGHDYLHPITEDKNSADA